MAAGVGEWGSGVGVQIGDGEQWRGMGGGGSRGGEGGRLGSLPSGRCVNPCDAAILTYGGLSLDNTRGVYK